VGEAGDVAGEVVGRTVHWNRVGSGGILPSLLVSLAGAAPDGPLFSITWLLARSLACYLA
jgi:hypothetical protein